jgi:hypothetical protein
MPTDTGGELILSSYAMAHIVHAVHRSTRPPQALAVATEGPAIVTSISRKEARFRRMEQAAEDAAIRTPTKR